MINPIPYLFSGELIEAVGWMILHSIWQGLLLALVLSLLLLFLRKSSAQVRYLVSFFFLVFFLGLNVFNFSRAFQYANEKQEIREQILSNPDFLVDYIQETYQIKEVEATDMKSKQANLGWILFKARVQNKFNLIILVWILGVILFLARLTGGFAYAFRLRSSNKFALDPDVVNKIQELSCRFKIRRTIEAFQSTLAKVPIALGFFKPVILFPVSALSGYTPKELEAIIAHEIAHIVRHDYVLNIIQSVIEIIFFYHPGVWIISRQIRIERENSCNELAIRATGDRKAYIKALATTQENVMNESKLLLSFASGQGSLLQRVKRIKNYRNMKTNFTEGFIAAALVFFGLILLSFTFEGQQIKDLRSDNNFLEEKAPEVVIDPDTIARPNVKAVPIVPADSSISRSVIVLHDHHDLPKEMEKVIEIVMLEEDDSLAHEILLSVQDVLADISIDEIVDEAMIEAHVALKELELNELICDSFADSMALLEADIEIITKESLEAARIALENIDIDVIVVDALAAAAEALDEIDLDAIVKDAMEEARRGNIHCYDEEVELEDLQMHLEEEMKSLEEHMLQLKEELERIEELKLQEENEKRQRIDEKNQQEDEVQLKNKEERQRSNEDILRELEGESS